MQNSTKVGQCQKKEQICRVKFHLTKFLACFCIFFEINMNKIATLRVIIRKFMGNK